MRNLSALATLTISLATFVVFPGIAVANSTTNKEISGVSTEPYILGPGDSVFIEHFNLPELSGTFSIGPDGVIYLPRLRSLQVGGLTIDELRFFLTDQYRAYLKSPQLYITPVVYRTVRVYIGGEVVRPGYYSLSVPRWTSIGETQQTSELQPSYIGPKATDNKVPQYGAVEDDSTYRRWPTLFDAIQLARGVTIYSDLSNVRVTRNRPIGAGGGKKQATIDFSSVMMGGEESLNIRLFDGDKIYVPKADKEIKEQLLLASRTNLSPPFIDIFVSGRVQDPGKKTLPQGSTLNQAIASAGGPKLLRGGVQFLRFGRDGESDFRQFSYNSSAKSGDYKNPVLMDGDIVRINDSLFSAGVNVLNEVTGPAVGIYSVYSLFKP